MVRNRGSNKEAPLGENEQIKKDQAQEFGFLDDSIASSQDTKFMNNKNEDEITQRDSINDSMLMETTHNQMMNTSNFDESRIEEFKNPNDMSMMSDSTTTAIYNTLKEDGKYSALNTSVTGSSQDFRKQQTSTKSKKQREDEMKQRIIEEKKRVKEAIEEAMDNNHDFRI